MSNNSNNNMWAARGIALANWLDSVQVAPNILGTVVDDMYVKKYTLYHGQQPMVTYATSKVAKTTYRGLHTLKAIKSLDSGTGITDMHRKKLESITSGAYIPIKSFVGMPVIVRGEKKANRIMQICCSSEGTTISVGHRTVGNIRIDSTFSITEIGDKVCLYHKQIRNFGWLKITDGGFIHPVEIPYSTGSILIDNTFIYIKLFNNEPTILGAWVDEKMVFNADLDKQLDPELYKNLLKLLVAMTPVKDLIVPTGLISSHKIELSPQALADSVDEDTEYSD